MGITSALITFLLPVLYIIGGIYLMFRASSYLCKGPAYKTKRAKLSEETWHYANFNYGIILLFMGIYVLILTGLIDAIMWRIGLRKSELLGFCILVIVIQAILALLPFYSTEQHLKSDYNDQGEEVIQEKKRRFFHRKNEEEWEDWDDSDEEEESDGWLSWKSWLHKRDLELDQERIEKEKIEDQQAIQQSSMEEEGFDLDDPELDLLFEELEHMRVVNQTEDDPAVEPEDSPVYDSPSVAEMEMEETPVAGGLPESDSLSSLEPDSTDDAAMDVSSVSEAEVNSEGADAADAADVMMNEAGADSPDAETQQSPDHPGFFKKLKNLKNRL